jgi:hypothetical protein
MSRTVTISGPRKFELDDYMLKVDILRVDNRKDLTAKARPPTLVFGGAVSMADWVEKLQTVRAEQLIELGGVEAFPSLAPSHIKNALHPTVSIDACFEVDTMQLVSLGDEHHTFFYEVRLCRSDGKFVLVTLESRLPESYTIITMPWTDIEGVNPNHDHAESRFQYPYTLCVETPVCPDFLSPLLLWPQHQLVRNAQHTWVPGPHGQFSYASGSDTKTSLNSRSVCRVSFDVQPLPWATGFRGSSIVRPSVLRHCNVEFLFVSKFDIDPTTYLLSGFVGSRFSTSDEEFLTDMMVWQDPYNPRHASTVQVIDFLDQLAFDNPNSLNVFKSSRRK